MTLPLEEIEARARATHDETVLALVARVRELEGLKRDQIIAAFEAGAQAVHEHHCPDRPDDGDFTEAACDYADSLP